MKKGTKTSAFGVSKREGHDSSQFYNSKLYDGLRIEENLEIVDNSEEIDPSRYGRKNKFDDSEIAKLPNSSLHLIIYVISDLNSVDVMENAPFLRKLVGLFDLGKEKLASGGRIAVIVDNMLLNENAVKVYFPLHRIINSLFQERGFLMRGEIILLSDTAVDSGFGTLSILKGELASLRNVYSKALIYSKQLYNRNKKRVDGEKLRDSIDRDTFLESTKSLWSNTHSETEGPLGFQLKRLCQLYSFVEDSILIVSRQPFDLDDVRKKIIYISL